MTNGGWRRAFRFWDNKVEYDVDEEFAFHFAMRVEQFMAQGMTREAAERAAREQFGNEREVRATLVDFGRRSRRRRDWRDTWDSLAHDFVVAARALRRAPLFTFGVVLTLGLGLGANATMFGIVDGLMLRGPAHVAKAREVQRLYITTNGVGNTATVSGVGYVTYAALRDHATSFVSVGGYGLPHPVSFGTDRDAPTYPVAYATWDFFSTLRVRAVIGRFFSADEDGPLRTAKVAVVGERLWRTELGGSGDALGRSITVGGQSYTVVGVAPAAFAGVERAATDVWLPMTLLHPVRDWTTSYNAQWMRVVARLKPGATAEQAGVEATTLLRGAYTGAEPPMRQLVASMRPTWYNGAGQPTAVVNVSRWLMGVAVIVLLIACANVVNLVLARTRRRTREVAVRVALGAGRMRVVRFLVVEIVLLAFGGAAMALAVAAGGGRLMRATLLAGVSWEETTLDMRVVLFALGAAALVTIVVGVMPALYATRVAVAPTLKNADRADGSSRSHLRTSLMVVQAALCVVLLVGAGLFVESLSRSRRVDLGFQAERVVRVQPRFAPLGQVTPEEETAARTRRRQALADAVERLRRLPEIEHAAVAVGTPYGYGFSVDIKVPGYDSIPTQDTPSISAVTSTYFATVGTSLRRGRVFTAEDREGSALVTIVNETMARRLWPGEEPIGKCLQIAQPVCSSVIGVVADVHRESLREKASLQYYVPLGQEKGIGGSVLLIRPRGDVVAAMPLIRRSVLESPVIPNVVMETIQQSIDPEYRPWKLGAAMFGVFGVLALIVASVGLYSVIAYLVTDRTRELGVRIALGASGGRILRDVVLSGISTTIVGVALGIGVALASARFIEPLLFDMSAKNPVVYAAVAVLVLVIAAFAAWSPARRASRVDPVIALRAD